MSLYLSGINIELSEGEEGFLVKLFPFCKFVVAALAIELEALVYIINNLINIALAETS
jgi:hypothetical protein